MLQLSKEMTMKYSFSLEAAEAHYPDAYKIVPFHNGVIVFLTETTYNYNKSVLLEQENS